jgi:hypothetical protein
MRYESIYRFEHIVAYSSFKALSKQPILKSARFFFRQAGHAPSIGHNEHRRGPALNLQAAFADINIANDRFVCAKLGGRM